MRRALAILRLRCPRCLRGPVFHGLWKTNERCASYEFGLLTTGYWLPMLLLGVNPAIIMTVPTVHLLVQTPFAFRYSRVIWLHVDHWLDPARAGWDATS